jgi:hypothetical protein
MRQRGGNESAFNSYHSKGGTLLFTKTVALFMEKGSDKNRAILMINISLKTGFMNDPGFEMNDDWFEFLPQKWSEFINSF